MNISGNIVTIGFSLLLLFVAIFFMYKKGIISKTTLDVFAAIATILALILAFLVFIIPAPSSPEISAEAQMEKASSTPSDTPTNTPDIPTRTPVPCPYIGENDEETFFKLIKQEEEIILNKNDEDLSNVYLSNAYIHDVKRGNVWESIYSRYINMFRDETYIYLHHYDFELVGNTGSEAWVTTSTVGEYITEATGESVKFGSAPSADHWTFAKDSNDCWKIAILEYGAANEPFP